MPDGAKPFGSRWKPPQSGFGSSQGRKLDPERIEQGDTELANLPGLEGKRAPSQIKALIQIDPVIGRKKKPMRLRHEPVPRKEDHERNPRGSDSAFRGGRPTRCKRQSYGGLNRRGNKKSPTLNRYRTPNSGVARLTHLLHFSGKALGGDNHEIKPGGNISTIRKLTHGKGTPTYKKGFATRYVRQI